MPMVTPPVTKVKGFRDGTWWPAAAAGEEPALAAVPPGGSLSASRSNTRSPSHTCGRYRAGMARREPPGMSSPAGVRSLKGEAAWDSRSPGRERGPKVEGTARPPASPRFHPRRRATLRTPVGARPPPTLWPVSRVPSGLRTCNPRMAPHLTGPLVGDDEPCEESAAGNGEGPQGGLEEPGWSPGTFPHCAWREATRVLVGAGVDGPAAASQPPPRHRVL